MSAIIYCYYPNQIEKKRDIGVIVKTGKFPEWLRKNGSKCYNYQLYKNNKIHSSWAWRLAEKRWGRMATAPKVKMIIHEEKVVRKSKLIK